MQAVSPTSMGETCLAYRRADLYITVTQSPALSACVSKRLSATAACANKWFPFPQLCKPAAASLPGCLPKLPLSLIKGIHAVNAALICCPLEALNGFCAVAREEWKHCSTATMCWPWRTGQMASCWHLLPWMARSTCGILKKLSSWYVL